MLVEDVYLIFKGKEPPVSVQCRSQEVFIAAVVEALTGINLPTSQIAKSTVAKNG